MLHLGPGASRKRVPPSPDVPSGNTLGSITRRSHKSPTACSPRASTIPGSLSLASSGHHTPHGQAGGGSRPPGSAPLHRRPPRRPPPAAKKLRAPACGIMFVPHIMPPAPKIPVAMLWELRFGCVVRVVHIGGSRGHLRALTASSAVLVIPGASAFVPHLCSLVIPAGSLDPAPCGGKEHLSVLRSQNPVFTGFAKHRQSQGGGITASPSGAGRSRLGKHGSSRHQQAAAACGFNPPSAFNPSHPPPLAAAARGVAK
jgi:hypothetical protein